MSRHVPQEMAEYLLTLLSPPEPHPPAEMLDLEATDWQSIGDESLTGLIVVGTPDEAMTATFMRILKPGAHMMVIAPEDNPIGHRGANTLESGGFEIRDTMLVVEDASDPFHYMPKVSRSEREAGCEDLPEMSGADATGRVEGSEGLKSPRSGASRTARQVKNHHPCVKPWKLMRDLMQGVPKGQVMDPFMGSGSTGIACLHTGHDFIGIDMTPEYMKIATARIEHWDHAHPGIRDLKLHTDLRHEVAEPEEEVDLFEAMFHIEDS